MQYKSADSNQTPFKSKAPKLHRNKSIILTQPFTISLVDECSVGNEFSVIDKNSGLDIKSVGYGISCLDENSVVAEKKKLL